MSTVNYRQNPHTWSIGLAEWILQDGSYNGFEVGKDYQFAVELYFEDFEVISGQTAFAPSVSKLAESLMDYSIIAPVVYKDDEIYMLDLGCIIAYDECPPKDRKLPDEYAARGAKILSLDVGDVIRADVALNIDHYSYFEFHCFRDGVPPIIYTWHIDSIQSMTGMRMLDPTTPNSNAFCIDPKTVQYHQLENTWSSGARSGYSLQCSLRPVPPVGREHNIPLE